MKGTEEVVLALLVPSEIGALSAALLWLLKKSDLFLFPSISARMNHAHPWLCTWLCLW